MAKLSAHAVFGKIDYLTYSLAWGLDGTVLVNHGDGWTIKGRIKNSTPESCRRHFEASQNLKLAWEESHPHYAKYLALLHRTVGRSYWGLVHSAVVESGNDPDGLWSTLGDFDYKLGHLTLDDCLALCKAFDLYQAERQANPPQGVNVTVTR